MAVKDGLGPAGRLVIIIIVIIIFNVVIVIVIKIKMIIICGQIAPAGGAPEHKGALQVRNAIFFFFFFGTTRICLDSYFLKALHR